MLNGVCRMNSPNEKSYMPCAQLKLAKQSGKGLTDNDMGVSKIANS